MITKKERLQKAVKHFRNRLLSRPGSAVPVLIFGEQRSGTNMLFDCFRRCLATAAYNETDNDAFVDYELRELSVIERIVKRSAASHVVFKPTTDSNRADEILDSLNGSRGIWIYRNYADVVTSALALFKETSLEYLTNVAARSPRARWRGRNLNEQDLRTIQAYLDSGISEASARALIWHLRNEFFFRLGLADRPDVLLLNYEELVQNPMEVVGSAFEFVGLPFRNRYVNQVFTSSIGRRPTPEIDERVAVLCAESMRRLNERRVAGTPAIESAAGGSPAVDSQMVVVGAHGKR